MGLVFFFLHDLPPDQSMGFITIASPLNGADQPGASCISASQVESSWAYLHSPDTLLPSISFQACDWQACQPKGKKCHVFSVGFDLLKPTVGRPLQTGGTVG
jgi:hypothetical protein